NKPARNGGQNQVYFRLWRINRFYRRNREVDRRETIDFMNGLEKPWIAFKVLAAGAIKAKDGFQYVFDNGADFICVVMCDFQVVEDANLALDTLANVNRVRPWRG